MVTPPPPPLTHMLRTATLSESASQSGPSSFIGRLETFHSRTMGDYKARVLPAKELMQRYPPKWSAHRATCFIYCGSQLNVSAMNCLLLLHSPHDFRVNGGKKLLYSISTPNLDDVEGEIVVKGWPQVSLPAEFPKTETPPKLVYTPELFEVSLISLSSLCVLAHFSAQLRSVTAPPPHLIPFQHTNGGADEMHWYLNFADPTLFVAYQGMCFLVVEGFLVFFRTPDSSSPCQADFSHFLHIGGLFAQDEMQCAMIPALPSIKEAYGRFGQRLSCIVEDRNIGETRCNPCP